MSIWKDILKGGLIGILAHCEIQPEGSCQNENRFGFIVSDKKKRKEINENRFRFMSH